MKRAMVSILYTEGDQSSYRGVHCTISDGLLPIFDGTWASNDPVADYDLMLQMVGVSGIEMLLSTSSTTHFTMDGDKYRWHECENGHEKLVKLIAGHHLWLSYDEDGNLLLIPMETVHKPGKYKDRVVVLSESISAELALDEMLSPFSEFESVIPEIAGVDDDVVVLADCISRDCDGVIEKCPYAYYDEDMDADDLIAHLLKGNTVQLYRHDINWG